MAYRSGTPSVDTTTIKIEAAEALRKAAVAYKKLLDDDAVFSKASKVTAGEAIKREAQGSTFPQEKWHIVVGNVEGADKEAGGCCSGPSLTFRGQPTLVATNTSADIAEKLMTLTRNLGGQHSHCIQTLKAEVEEHRNELLKGLRENALALVRAQKSFEGADAAERNAPLSDAKARMTQASTQDRVLDMVAAAGNDAFKSDQAMLNKVAGGTGRPSVKQDIADERYYAGELVRGQGQVLEEARHVAEMAQTARDAEDEKIKKISKDVTNRARAYFHLGEKGKEFELAHFVGDGEFTGATSADIIEFYDHVQSLWSKAKAYAKFGADVAEGDPEWEAAEGACYNLAIQASAAIAGVLRDYKKLDMNKLAVSIGTFLEAYKAGADGRQAQDLVDKAQGKVDAKQDIAANAQVGKAVAGVLNREDERHTGALHQATTSAADDLKARTEALEAEVKVAKLKAELAAAEAKASQSL